MPSESSTSSRWCCGRDVEGEEVLLVAHLDGGEALDSEQVLEAGVDHRVGAVHDDGALLHDLLDQRVGRRHLEPGRQGRGLRRRW